MTRQRVFLGRPVPPAVWVFLAFAFLYIAITRGHFIGTDEIAMYQTSRSLWERGDLSIAPINNTFEGRGRRFYSQYSPGQAVAAVPLYAVGWASRRVLQELGAERVLSALAGPLIGAEPNRWGGDVEIFFVNLFNAFVTALLCAVFFTFTMRLGVGKHWALVSTVLLGLTSYVAPFSAGFLQHSSEALFLLLAFYWLFRDAQREDRRFRLAAGVSAGLMVLFRLQSAIALPALSLYALATARRRKGNVIREGAAFLIPVIVAIVTHAAVNYLKFETVLGRYNNEGFHASLLQSLYAFLFSVGDSVFIFTPLLLLTPWTLSSFTRQYRGEGAFILGLAATYLLFYGKYTAWHGLWSALGPRYLVPIVALLMLPIGPWMEQANRRSWVAVAALGAIGLGIQALHVAVNFAYVYHHENWPGFQPPYGFLFVPENSPIVAFARAFVAHDFRVDMWLVNVYRAFGSGYVLAFLLPLLLLLMSCLVKLRDGTRGLQSPRATRCTRE